MSDYTLHTDTDPHDLIYFLDDNVEQFSASELVTFIELIDRPDIMRRYVLHWASLDDEAVVTETDNEIRVQAYEEEQPFITFPK